jgi:superfamily II DNA helicase RecQ
MLKQIKHPFEPSSYFELKSTFVAADFPVNAYSKVSSGKNFKVAHPALYKKLVELRNKICEKGGDIPVYMVAANKSLQQMADYLPTSERDLMEIHGFGKTKVVKYGKDFLSVILDYCLENNLTSTIYEKSAELASGKKKKKK